MGPFVALHHQTRYRYDRPVTLGPQEIRLKPAPTCRTPVRDYVLTLRPVQHSMRWYHDAAGNSVLRALFQEKVPRLEIDVDFIADLTPLNAFDFLVEAGAERFPFRYPDAVAPELAPFLVPAESGERLARWRSDLEASERPDGRGTLDLLTRINKRIARDVAYVVRHEHGVQPSEETLNLRSGSCRDSSWLLVQILRHFNFAARFVSGYLVQLASDEPDAPKRDSADLHAWAEVYLPGAGWIGLDPTSGLLAAECHIPLARASWPALAAPLSGSVEPSRSEMEYSLSVKRLP